MMAGSRQSCGGRTDKNGRHGGDLNNFIKHRRISYLSADPHGGAVSGMSVSRPFCARHNFAQLDYTSFIIEIYQ
jgi:hypothetical protein